MAAFAVISLAPNDALAATIKATYGDAGNSLELSKTFWLVSDSSVTTQDVCKKLNITRDGIQNVVVIRADNYWGIASSNIWEWLQVKRAEP